MRRSNSATRGQGPDRRDAAIAPIRARALDALALTPEIVAVSTAMFVMGLGENLWRRFLPKYLESFGAPVTAIGLFGTTEDFLDGVYQYPGGWVADRYGRRRALLLFVSLSALGSLLFAVMPAWPVAFAALALIMAWEAMCGARFRVHCAGSSPPTSSSAPARGWWTSSSCSTPRTSSASR